MKNLSYLLILLIGMFSCSSESSIEKEIKADINQRIELMNRSFTFKVIQAFPPQDNFDKIKQQIDIVLNSTSSSEVSNSYSRLVELFELYKVSLPTDSKTNAIKLYNVLIALDNLIFKYSVSRIHLSDYKAIVVPNSTSIKQGELFKAQIYITASDTLFEPDIRYIGRKPDGTFDQIYRIPCQNGIGDFRQPTKNQKGKQKIEGFILCPNEFGRKDTLNWQYEYEVK